MASSSSPERFYADATCLIGLARIDRLDLLVVLPIPIYVTAVVWSEVTGDATKPGTAAIHQAADAGLLVIVEEGDPGALPELDPGESSVLTAAAAAHAGVLADERKARQVLTANGYFGGSIPVLTGVVGLLLFAKTRGRLRAVKPLLDDLIQQRFWISPSLYEMALRQAEE